MSIGYWPHYEVRRKILPIAYNMEHRGVTVSIDRHRELVDEFKRESDRCGCVLISLAEQYDWPLELPKGSAVNNNLRDFIFDVMKLEPIINPKAKTDAPSLDSKNAIPHYLKTLERGSMELHFIQTLQAKRARDGALGQLMSYSRFWRAIDDSYAVLHPNLNPTGTATIRWSCSNPNEQNIARRGILTEQDCEHCEGLGCKTCEDSGKQAANVRYCFGPREGREWWSCDAKNIERRITAYKAPEPDIIALLERPDDPPYYGSEHALIGHILHPIEFNECIDKNGQLDGRIFKKRYQDTLYAWTKNGNFAVQYSAGRATADATYKVKGAYDKIQSRFKNQAALNTRLVAHAKRYGYVETVPDISVDPKRGYPLLCARTEYGEILPTTPLNYWGQGTACYWMMQSMIRCHEQLEKWRVDESFDGYITLQVHDELVFDFPYCSNCGNLDKVMRLKELMEVNGNNLSIITPVSIEYNEHHWSEGVTCA